MHNNSRGRAQAEKKLPCGVPAFILQHPEVHGCDDYGVAIPEQNLVDVAEDSGVFDKNEDFVPAEFRVQFHQHTLILTFLDCHTVDHQKSELSILRRYVDIGMHRLRYC